ARSAVVQTDGVGVTRREIDNRRAVQPHVVCRDAQALGGALAEAQHEVESRLRRELPQGSEPAHVDEEKLLRKREVFLQEAIAEKGVSGIWEKSFLFTHARGLHGRGPRGQGSAQCLSAHHDLELRGLYVPHEPEIKSGGEGKIA